MSLVRENATSLYRQIAGLLREEIVAGHYEPTGHLPSEAEIGKRFGVSRVTVRLALNELQREGLISRRKGKGTFVAGKQVRHRLDSLRSFHESLKMQGLEATMRIVEVDLISTPPQFTHLFGTHCASIDRLHLVDNEPIALGRSFLPAALAGIRRAEVERHPTYLLLTNLVGRELGHASLSIGAEPASSELAAVLGVTAGAALLVMERTSYFDTGAGAEHSTFYIRPERYRFVLKSRVAIAGDTEP